MTVTSLYAFIKAFPLFVDFLRTAYGDFVKLQIHRMEKEADAEKLELKTEIAKLKGAKTDEEIAIAIAALNRR